MPPIKCVTKKKYSTELTYESSMQQQSHTTAQGQSAEPIAIVGLGCRLPGGANDWQSYWNLLLSATDAITETPAQRWNLQKFYSPESKPGTTQSKWGGYVNDIDQFDPQLFGISPREAASMDPQQRMLLEVAFRALEDAGQPLKKVAGRQVSVYVGISSFDYAVAGLSYQDRAVIDAYSNTGGSSSIAANRISYCFDLRGPSVAVDTACSSSLVAIHMACESLWRGEAEMALAGGVNALLLPDFYVAFSRLGVLSPDGRCKTFDERANGYVRSEGAGMILLKPLSQAMRDMDPVYAVVRSTALNQDGRTPGMTVPSQSAQEALIRTACQKAGIEPRQLQYVEAHGTGTPVGDPIEARALAAALGEGRSSDHPCWIGSVKTNIGHLEAGAGIASVLKVALALHHRRIPAHLHFQAPNPAIDFAALNLRVPTTVQDWDAQGATRLAGVNGFGYGGANAHIILEQAPELTAEFHTASIRVPQHQGSVNATATKQTKAFRAPVLIPLSARNPTALLDSATQLADWLATDGRDIHLAEVAGYVAHRRSHHEQRATACAVDHDEMISALRLIAAAHADELIQNFNPSQLAKGAAFVCSGQGPQWWAMGRGLLKYSPSFRTTIKRCDVEFAKYGNWSLLEELSRDESESRMQRTAIAQPSIFAVQVALAALWASWGIAPTTVVGHSVGEIAAAYLTGALTWEDACCVAFHRGRTMDLASSHGAMLAAGLSPKEVQAWIAGLENKVSLAAINGPSSVTISGAADAIESLAQRLERQGVFCRRLAVEYAFHSPQMEPVRDELLRSLAHIRPRDTHTSLISTVTGGVLGGTEVGADYWWQNVRQCVRFSDAMTCLAQNGYGLAVEIGPHPVLAYSINECFQSAGSNVRCVASLNRHQEDLQCISKSLGTLYTLGFDIHWSGFYNQPIRKLAVPTYPFQNQRCWSESLESSLSRLATVEHPLLGESMAGPTPRWEQRIDLQLQSYLSDHRVRGATVYPAAAIIETAIAACKLVSGSEVVRLQRIRLHTPCILSNERPQWIETSFDTARQQLQLSFRDCNRTDWSALASVNLSQQTPQTSINPCDFAAYIDAIRSRCTERFDRTRLYAYCSALGLQYAHAFQAALSGLVCPGEALVEVGLLDPALASESHNYNLHPALLDSCFHAMIAADRNFDHTLDGLYLPAEIHEVTFHRAPGERAIVHARMLRKTPKLMTCDLDVFTPQGELCIAIRHFESRRVGGGHLRETTEDLAYSYAWVEQELGRNHLHERATESKTDRTSWLLFMDEASASQELSQRLRALGNQVIEVYREDSHVVRSGMESFYQVDPESSESFERVLNDIHRKYENQLAGVVYLWGLDVPATDALNPDALERSSILTTLAPLNFVQAWERQGNAYLTDFAIVTNGGQSQDGIAETTNVAQGPLIGFGRVVVSESSKLRTKLIDLPIHLSTRDYDNLVNELFAEDDEDEVLWRSGMRYAHRFQPQVNREISVDAALALPCQLRVGQSAGIEEMHYATKKVIKQLATGKLEIEVLASGLNFSDVMKVLDLYPGLPDGPVDLGAECSGRVSRVAPGSAWRIGDEVIAVAPGSFATHVVVDEALVARKPSHLSHTEAAAIPIAFLTADYALNKCARLRSGESLLIHSASGGVGLAAMQLAKLAGVQIFATAGSDEKRRIVREAGASCVMDSRSLAFGDETLQATGGYGVDAILNSLPGQAIQVGLSILRTGGRFLEIGKRDIYSDAALGLYPFRNNLALFAIDLDQLFKKQPQRMGNMLRKIVERFETGELQPLPTRVYSASDTNAAFRFMQSGSHIGKVVVAYEQRPTRVQVGEYAPLDFNSDGTYWLAGGLGGFGLQIARWIVDRGARTLVLSGRSPTLSVAAEKTVQELRQRGARVVILPVDITAADEVRRALETIDRTLPKLRGVIHTAMVLEDKLLRDLDRETLERVLRPKVLGGWNLHEQTLGRKLDLFVMFSSLSSVFGHAGQANYSAANAFLDSLAYMRRSQGLPALVMNWGHLGEVGYLAEREQLGQRLERQGVLSFTVKQATDCLEYALQSMAIQMSVLRIDWSVWRGLGLTQKVSPRFAHLLQSPSESEAVASDSQASAEQLRATSGALRSSLVEALLRSKLSSLLGLNVEQIQPERALLEMGLDSLMAVEVRNWIESQMEIDLPISALMRGESLAHLAARICELMDEQNSVKETKAPDSHSIGDADAAQLLSELPNMEAEEVSRLLAQMLRGES
jgi:acyl transferase domain-containing protein/NADPH:quinone reductase-like Zn-dependent oxidoreductase/acyl carrier protein